MTQPPPRGEITVDNSSYTVSLVPAVNYVFFREIFYKRFPGSHVFPVHTIDIFTLKIWNM